MDTKMSIDLPLDEIIKLDRLQKRNSRRRFDSRENYRTRNSYSRVYKSSRHRMNRTNKTGRHSHINHLLVSNLAYSVNDQDIRELFSEFGRIKKSFVNYDKSGRSHGTAEVLFYPEVDASIAIWKYNNVPLDSRPMRIELLDSHSANLSSRLYYPIKIYRRNYKNPRHTDYYQKHNDDKEIASAPLNSNTSENTIVVKDEEQVENMADAANDIDAEHEAYRIATEAFLALNL